MNRKKAIGLIGFGLSLFLVIHGMDVSAQQILPNDSLNTTANTTTNSAVGTTNNTAVSIRSAKRYVWLAIWKIVLPRATGRLVSVSHLIEKSPFYDKT